MSDQKKYTAVVHASISAIAEITPEESGINVKLTGEPSVRADSIIFFGSDASKYTQEEIALMARLCRFSAIKRTAEIEKLPEEVLEATDHSSSTPTKVGGDLN